MGKRGDGKLPGEDESERVSIPWTQEIPNISFPNGTNTTPRGPFSRLRSIAYLSPHHLHRGGDNTRFRNFLSTKRGARHPPRGLNLNIEFRPSRKDITRKKSRKQCLPQGAEGEEKGGRAK